MFNEINDRLVQARERLRQKRKLEAMLKEANRTLRDEQRKEADLGERLAKEKADVDKLEGLGLTSMFYSILGTKRERIDKEKREYVSAKLKFEESSQAVGEASKDVEQLEKELSQLQAVDAEYQRLLEEKHRLLAQSGDARAEKLLALSERLGELTSDKKELNEAIQAGESALRELERVQSALGSAANWATGDMLGGGMMATMAKHSKIDTAKQFAHSAQRHLRRFQKELADADERLQVSFDIGGFSKFADYFFDGLIADWMVQSKIQNASSACSSAISQVSSVLTRCRGRLGEVDREMEEAATQRREFVEKA